VVRNVNDEQAAALTRQLRIDVCRAFDLRGATQMYARLVHQHRNRYEADLTLSAAGGAWKITGFDVCEQERLSP
jgi:hypothetical protein